MDYRSVLSMPGITRCFSILQRTFLIILLFAYVFAASCQLPEKPMRQSVPLGEALPTDGVWTMPNYFQPEGAPDQFRFEKGRVWIIPSGTVIIKDLKLNPDKTYTGVHLWVTSSKVEELKTTLEVVSPDSIVEQIEGYDEIGSLWKNPGESSTRLFTNKSLDDASQFNATHQSGLRSGTSRQSVTRK